jgi:hypothetical protein
MGHKSSSPWTNLSHADIQRLITFFDPAKNSELNKLQTDGCYHLWNTLCDDGLRFAYLADEVGMGKTYQALGVLGVLHYLKPSARVIIICPGKEMQKQWSSDWHSFFQEKYCPAGMDGQLKSRRINANGVPSFESSVQPLLCDNLAQFAASLVAAKQSAYLLRYPSFSLPLRVFDWAEYRKNREALVQVKELIAEFRKVMEDIGFPLEEKDFAPYSSDSCERLPLGEASRVFLSIHARCIARLVNVFAPDLVIWDEAQYLRTDASRNDCMRTIFGGLHRQGCRHLFLSATPAHRDVSDIDQLNYLLSNSHEQKGRLIQVQQDDGISDSFRASVSRWMVRRERSFNGQGKLQYRDFHEEPVDMFAKEQSPLYALTFATMQKHLVKMLDGQNNKFRMGEISCHESARASIEAILPNNQGAAEEGVSAPNNILEESSKRNATEPIDESHLRRLGNRFKELQTIVPIEMRRDLPHAKVDHVVVELADRCLKNGSATKELVFVRRVATVDELADGLLREFQQVLNQRIDALGKESNKTFEDYWGLPPHTDDGDGNDADENETSEPTDSLGPVNELPYLKALSAVKGKLGRLTIYRNSLGKPETSTIRFLLVPQAEMTFEDQDAWQRFLRALEITNEAYSDFRNDSNKELLLRRCLAHSLRFTDILVDLDFLRQDDRLGYVKRWVDMLSTPPSNLADYFSNTRKKLRGWFEHFDTIVNKCFKGSGPHNSYLEIAERVATYFRGLSPVARRSGRRTDENAVIQFKFPVSPNVLICTDVLREGVNLHLFCERVSHYGIAWNSGDLEQRIGRVERADSLFERKILDNPEHKLHVGFPYLARTLDERQVKKAIRRKRDIDGLFSIIPPRESGECDDSLEEFSVASAITQGFEPLLPPMDEWPSKGEAWPDHNRKELQMWDSVLNHTHTIIQSTTSKLDLQGFEYSCCRMLGELKLLVIEWVKLSGSTASPSWLACDRLIFDTFERKKQWKAIRSLYLPIDHALTEETVKNFWQNVEAGVGNTSADSEHRGFTYCGLRNTHIQEHKIEHPVEPAQERSQISYRYRWGTGHAIASIVGEIDEDYFSAEKAKALAIEINKSLSLGCATLQNNRLMLLFPQVGGFVWDINRNSHISGMLAHWADRRQWILMNGADDENDFHSLPVSGISEMNTSQAINILSSLRKWCEDLNQAINAECSHMLEWRLTNLDRLMSTRMMSAASPFVSIPGFGKFQIAYSVTGLNTPEEEKSVVFFLAAKPANLRVVANDMDDIWRCLSGSKDYESWLTDDYFVEINERHFHYAYANHHDGRQYRRLRLEIPASNLESYSDRDNWLQFITKLATYQLFNDVFQYNSARSKMEQYLAST